MKHKFNPTERAKAFLDHVENGSHKREIVKGIQKFIDKNVPGIAGDIARGDPRAPSR